MTTRREFIKAAGAAAAVATVPEFIARAAHARGADSIRIGVIGCGGRGTGAAADALAASPGTQVVALADAFPHRVKECRGNLAGLDEGKGRSERARVAEDRCYTGFDAYQRLLEAGDVDMVVLATPPHFRPIHFEAAVKAGKNVFMEKPVAVDGPGVRRVLAAGEEADRKGLCVVAGTQRRHEKSYLEAMAKVKEGAIGKIVSARCYWNQGGLWVVEKEPEWSDMEWQLRNWLYFTWLSGDHIVEQHVHNLDVVNWALGAHPVKCMGMGGRQVRTEPKYGYIFDHFAIEYEYPDGTLVTSTCRQIDGCAARVEERFRGTSGGLMTRPGMAAMMGEQTWMFSGENPNPYEQEHRDLAAAITGGNRVNETRNVAEATLTAIMGRMSAYTGKEVTWEQALNSKEDLSPPSYEFGPLPVPPVAMPGRTPLV